MWCSIRGSHKLPYHSSPASFEHRGSGGRCPEEVLQDFSPTQEFQGGINPFNDRVSPLRYRALIRILPICEVPPVRMSHLDANTPSVPTRDFVRQIIDRDLSEGRVRGSIITRFPPEPNGFLHIGHAKSIVLNFGLAREFEGARCHLRFDDTNPTTEDLRYAEAIQEDVRWLGYDWEEHLYYASDYFEAMYGFAVELIHRGLAYVDSQSEEESREGKGTVTQSGRESPWRSRSLEENLDLFRRMREGEFPDGTHVLRARIDMASPNMLMRDPVLYRIRHAHHFRAGDAWKIYPMYDFAHPIEDALEGITHSLCTLEFANNRELYDWVIEHTSVPARPRQYEFARLNLDYTVMSKRKLLRLVEEGDVTGWDDPRMPTIAGLRRRGFTPEAIRSFCEMIGVARSDSRVDIGKLEYSIRDDLNQRAPRVMGVLDPVRVVLTDWPAGKRIELDAPYFPHDVPLEGSRTVPFTGELLIERKDFEEVPPPGYRRLVLGGEVRLRYACLIRCNEVVRGSKGEVVELRCTHDPASWGVDPPDGRRVAGTIHWLSAPDAIPCEVRLYDRLFHLPDPEAEAAALGEEGDFRAFLNPSSLETISGAFVEPSILRDPPETRYQFERIGYFWRDPVEGRGDRPTFNRIVTLRDTWSRTAGGKGAVESSAHSTPLRPGHSERAGGGAGESSVPGTGRATAPRSEASPELRERADALVRDFGIAEVEAGILAREVELADYLRTAAAALPDGASRPALLRALTNRLVNDLPPLRGTRALSELPFGPRELAQVVVLVAEGTISGSGGDTLLEHLAREGGDPRALVSALGLEPLRDEGALRALLEGVVAAHPAKVAEYRGGRTALLGFFMGQAMRESGGKGDPELLRELLEELLS